MRRTRGTRRAVVRTSFILSASVSACAERIQLDSEVGGMLAEHLCPIQAECDCAEDLLIVDCEDEVEREVARSEQAVIDRGLKVDSECLEAFLHRIDALASCGPLREHLSEPLACFVYAGAAEVGDACRVYEVFPPMSDCRQGLRCRDGTCFDPYDIPILQEGETCWVPSSTPNMQTGFLGECAEGLECDWRGICNAVDPAPPMVAMGDECLYGSQCPLEGYCRPPSGADQATEELPGVCTEYTPAGRACSLSYECEWICEQGVCQEPPTALCYTLTTWQLARASVERAAGS